MPKPFRITGKTLAVVLALLLVVPTVVALFLPGTNRSAGPTARRTQCMSNLRNIALAVSNYATANGGHLPPAYIADAAGRPMHSWRTLILPYLDRPDVVAVYRFDEPWDGPNNSKLHEVVIDVFRCPEDSGDNTSTQTSFVAIVGPETAWPGTGSATLDTIAAGDGTAQTLLLAEVVASGIHWMEPRDLELSRMAPTINPRTGHGISGYHRGSANVAFVDGRVKPLSENLPAATLRALLTIKGREPLSADDF